MSLSDPKALVLLQLLGPDPENRRGNDLEA